MKILLLMLLLSWELNAFTLEEDKQKHAIAGIIAQAGCIAIDRAFEVEILDDEVCLIFSIGIGIGKELYDATGRGTPDIMDAIYTGAGASSIYMGVKILEW